MVESAVVTGMRNQKTKDTGLYVVLICFLLLLSLIRFWPSDRWPILALLSYVPSPLLLFFSLSLFVACVLRRNKVANLRFWMVLLLIPIVLNLSWVYRENKPYFLHPEGSADKEGLRILHWNVWGSRMSPEAIAKAILEQRPDVVCLNEPSTTSPERTYPDYLSYMDEGWYQKARSNLQVLSRYRLDRLESFHEDGVKGMYFLIRSRPRKTFLLLDIKANVFYHRAKAFHFVSRFLEGLEKQPDVILGDLNTPHGSYSLEAFLGESYQDGYYLCGNTPSYTWPAWFPLTRIDFIFVHEKSSVLKHHQGYTRLSDHAWQMIVLKE